MYLQLVQLGLTALMFGVGSGQAWYLEVVHGRRRPRRGAPPVPLVQSVSGFRAQHAGSLLLLKVLDERQRSVSTGQVVALWRWNGRSATQTFKIRDKITLVLQGLSVNRVLPYTRKWNLVTECHRNTNSLNPFLRFVFLTNYFKMKFCWKFISKWFFFLSELFQDLMSKLSGNVKWRYFWGYASKIRPNCICKLSSSHSYSLFSGFLLSVQYLNSSASFSRARSLLSSIKIVCAHTFEWLRERIP